MRRSKNSIYASSACCLTCNCNAPDLFHIGSLYNCGSLGLNQKQDGIVCQIGIGTIQDPSSANAQPRRCCRSNNLQWQVVPTYDGSESAWRKPIHRLGPCPRGYRQCSRPPSSEQAICMQMHVRSRQRQITVIVEA